MMYRVYVHFENETKFVFDLTDIESLQSLEERLIEKGDACMTFHDIDGSLIYIATKNINAIKVIPMEENDAAC